MVADVHAQVQIIDVMEYHLWEVDDAYHCSEHASLFHSISDISNLPEDSPSENASTLL